MKHLTKTKLIWLAVALVPLLVVACSRDRSTHPRSTLAACDSESMLDDILNWDCGIIPAQVERVDEMLCEQQDAGTVWVYSECMLDDLADSEYIIFADESDCRQLTSRASFGFACVKMANGDLRIVNKHGSQILAANNIYPPPNN